jgi:glutathione S-transferase
MLIVHHLGASQSERIVWLCEELELDYELRRYDRDPLGRGLAPAAYKALHPLGTAPVITDGDVVLPESSGEVPTGMVDTGEQDEGDDPPMGGGKQPPSEDPEPGEDGTDPIMMK